MYFIYLDESGDSRFKEDIRPESDFFILGGFVIKERYLQEANKKFLEFKTQNFPESLQNYPIHAVELNQVSKHKKTKYKGVISDEQGKKILEEAYKVINTLPIEAIVVLVDTHELKEKYVTPENPYHLAYEILCEKVQKIVKKRNDPDNSQAIINLAEASVNLSIQLNKIHKECKKNGSKYSKWDNILPVLNIEADENSTFYDIADLICYAFRRSYYAWLCKNLQRLPIKDNYLSLIKDVCTLKIGHILIDDTVRIKVIPDPRFLKKKEETK